MSSALLLAFAILKYCNGQTFPQIREIDNIIGDTVLKLNPIIIGTAAFPVDVLATVLKNLPLPVSRYNYVDTLNKYLPQIKVTKVTEDADLNFQQLVTKYGYRFENHEVLTEDGYVLSLFRIPGNRSAVFLMHGLLGSAEDFILAGPESGLAYLLADEGHDVWLGNARGNKFSRRHVSAEPSEARFWNFSWHEIGVYDLPAMIDYALEKSDQSAVKYIGFSQGTTAFFVMASERPEYNSKVTLMIALSPVAYMSRARSPFFRVLGPSNMERLASTMGLYEFLPDSTLTNTMKQVICGAGLLSELFCSNAFFLIAGFDYSQMNVSNLPVIFGHWPCGASMKQFTHYFQGLASEDFRLFDYGAVGNLQRYGAMVPPSYALDKISTPVLLYFSDADWLADPRDVSLLGVKLKNVVAMYRVPYANFNHLDFVIAKDVKALVYDRFVKLLKMF